MFLELRAKKCFVFNNQIVFSLDPTNKTTAIYGPNNAGKTCLIKYIQAMKGILLNQRIELKSNLFSNDSVCELGITFEYEKKEYSYDVKYDTKTNQFVYECLTSKGDVLYKKDLLNRIFDCKDEQTKNSCLIWHQTMFFFISWIQSI